MKLKYKKFIFTAFAIGIIFVPALVFSQDSVSDQALGQLGAAQSQTQYSDGTDPRLIVADVVQVFLGLLGTIFFVLMVFSGYRWLTAGGQDDKIEQARKTIIRAVLGMIIVLLAYAITEFVATGILNAVEGNPAL